MAQQHFTPFSLVIRTPEEIIYQGNVFAVSSFNRKGAFDILTEHAHFISLIEKYITVRPTPNSQVHYSITQGILRMGDNTCWIGIDQYQPLALTDQV